MGIIKARRKVVGGKAEFKELINCLEGTLSNTTTVMYGAANPLGEDLIITEVIVNLTSPCSATPVTFSCGSDASGITVSSDNLIDEVVIGTPTAAAVYNSANNEGVNGALAREWKSDKFFTVTASSTPTGVTGKVYIYYRKV